MSFLNTSALWFLMALPPVVLLYLLKIKRDEELLPSTLLWEKVINDLAANTPFQRLRKNLLMLLQLLLLAAIVFSLVRPFVKGVSTPAASTVIIIDNSGSMNAYEGDRTRLEIAKAEAGKLLQGVSRGKRTELMLLSVNREARILSSFTADRAILKKRVRGLEPTEMSSNVTDALLVAASAVRGRPDSSVYLITDGCLKDRLPEMKALSDKLQVIQIGSSRANVAITNLAAEPLEKKGAYELFVSVKNFSDRERSVLMSMYDGDELIHVREMSPGPFGTKASSFIIEPRSNVIRCELDSDDALSADNRAHVVLEERKETSVLLVTSGSLFLSKAVASLENTRLATVSPSDYTDRMARESDVIIFDRWVPGEVPPKRCAFIAPPGSVGPATFTEGEGPVMITDYAKDDPLLRFVTLDDLYINKMNNVDNPQVLSAIAWYKGAPVIGYFALGKIEHLLICFDINNSEWPVRPSFPMFISNLVDEIAGANRSISAANVLTGSPIEINRMGSEERITAVKPGGGSVVVESGERNVRFFDTSRSGLYRFSIGEAEKLVAVNFFHNDESDVFHRRVLERERPPGTVAASVSSVNKEIWKYFAVGALIVSMIEWRCFHRKIQ